MTSKRKVFRQLTQMGFNENDIRSAIKECGYVVDQCAEWIVHKKKHTSSSSKPKLTVGMEVWVYSKEDQDWFPGNIVSVTKQLVSIIFNGWDFRWVEKGSDQFRIQNDKPSNPNNNNPELEQNHSGESNSTSHSKDEYRPPPQPQRKRSRSRKKRFKHSKDKSGKEQAQAVSGYFPPSPDELDYYVTFTESVLGLELFSDEDGFNCIVGRCVSSIAHQKVTPSSQIVQVNERWLANYRFEEIRDAVKQAARNPPLAITFRVKRNDLKQNQKQMKKKPSKNMSPNVYDENDQFLNVGNSGHSPMMVISDDEKRSRPGDVEFVSHMSLQECEQMQVGMHIDHRDDVGRFLLATIVDKQVKRVKIHYEGWNSKWDTWCDFQKEPYRFAKARSISRKPNTRFRDLKIRDYVDINPIQRHEGWRVGQIRRMDKYSGQAQIVYKEEGQEFLYWAHMNNPAEIAPFMTLAAETIAMKRQIKEQEQVEQDVPVVAASEQNRRYEEQQHIRKESRKLKAQSAYHHDASNAAMLQHSMPSNRREKMAVPAAYSKANAGANSGSGYSENVTYPYTSYKNPALSSAATVQTQRNLYTIPLSQQMQNAGNLNSGNRSSLSRHANANKNHPTKALPALPTSLNNKSKSYSSKNMNRSRTQPLPKNKMKSMSKKKKLPVPGLHKKQISDHI